MAEAEEELEEIEPEPIQLDLEEEPISLVDAEDEPAGGEGLKAFGPGARPASGVHKANLTRAVNKTPTGATRCRVFHSKIAVASLEYMENQINEWIDGQDIDVKHVGHVIGVMEGKTAEPNMIVMVWY